MDEKKVTDIIKDVLAPVLSKLDILCTKNDIEKISTELRDYYEKELSKRDTKIAMLEDKVTDLNNAIIRQKSEIDDMYTKISSNIKAINSKVTEKNAPKPLRDLVILGDSMVKHVDVDKVNQGGCNEIFCHPGARIEKIISEAKHVHSKYHVEELLLCVGTNHITADNPEPPEVVTDKLCRMIKEIRCNMPETKLYVTGILPKWNDRFTPGISFINDNLFKLQSTCGFKYISTRKFLKEGEIDTSLFSKRDMVHLNFKGVAKLATSFMFR